jgi:GNAT superfamily N-acetyltransferase
MRQRALPGSLHGRRPDVTERKRNAVSVCGMRPVQHPSCERPSGTAEARRVEIPDLLETARQPWTTRIGHQPVLVRQSTPWDLAAVAQLHARCSPRSLLDRYRSGGRAPAGIAIDRGLRNPLGVVAVARDGSVVATASVERDPRHSPLCAELAVLVEDAWQRRGLGSALAAHVAGVAQVAGFTELISYPATAVRAVQRLMVDIGRSRIVLDGSGEVHLHTFLTEGVTLGLGSVRERLAG